jgi:hypothetical protein
MLSLLFSLIGTTAMLAVVTGARALDAAQWRQSLCYRSSCVAE